MKLNLVSSFTLKDYENIGLIFNKTNSEQIKNLFPILKPYLADESFKYDGETILALTLFNDDKKHNYYIIAFNEDPEPQAILDAFGSLGKRLSSNKAKDILIHMAYAGNLIHHENNYLIALKGLSAGFYTFNKFQSDKKSECPESLDIYTDNSSHQELMADIQAICDSIRLTRELVDEPANLLKPVQLAEKAMEALANTVVNVQVIGRDDIQRLGMNLLLSVAGGSDAEPQLIVMRYHGDPSNDKTVGLIGKGLTYDSGGYSIKPTNGMLTMKSDMGGAAAVIGAMTLIAHEQPKINVVGVIAACENMISGHAYLPGDILTSMNGKTVEVANTDAEGRLTLADAMTYAIRHEGATDLIDICTLTGACLIALGEEYAGVVTWEDQLWDKVKFASDKTLEPCWRLPLNKTIKAKNNSKVADLNNSGGRLAGSEVAGAFVGEFSENKPWIHIDIAGTSYIDDEKPAYRIGATGFGVHLLVELAKNM